MKANDIERLVFSPFHTSRILHHFLSGVLVNSPLGIKTEVIYLVLPFIYCKETQLKLSTLNKNSKLNPFLNNKDFYVFLSNLNQRMVNYRIPTNTAIIVLSNDIEVKIDKYITIVDTIDYRKEKDIYLKSIYKSAYNFGMLLSKEEYLSLFKKLRITEL